MKYVELIEIGSQRLDIAHKIGNLLEKVRIQYQLYNRLNELGQYSKEDHLKESKERFEKLIIGQLNEINKNIDRYNKAASSILDAKTVRKVEIRPVKAEINKTFKKLEVDQDAYNLVSPYIEKQFADFLIKIVDPVFDDLVEQKKILDNYVETFKIGEYDTSYKKDLHQMADIYVMGYKSTAVLVLGRVFEKLFTLWGHSLIEEGKLSKTKEEFDELRFENILGLFKSRQLLNDKDWHVLSKLRLDRNVGGHYLSDQDALLRKETENEAEMTIRLALPLINKYHQLYVGSKE